LFHRLDPARCTRRRRRARQHPLQQHRQALLPEPCVPRPAVPCPDNPFSNVRVRKDPASAHRVLRFDQVSGVPCIPRVPLRLGHVLSESVQAFRRPVPFVRAVVRERRRVDPDSAMFLVESKKAP